MAAEIVAKRLRLRPVRTSDAPVLFAIRSHESVHRWLKRGTFKDLKAAEEWIAEAMEPEQFKFMIEPLDASTDSAVGVIGLNFDRQLGFQLDPSAWGNGYATEALRAYLPALFTTFPGLEDVKSLVLGGNVASKRVLEKCGFVDDNHLPQGPHEDIETNGYNSHSEDRREKIEELRIMLNGIGLQRSVNPPRTGGRSDYVVYTYHRPEQKNESFHS